MPLQISNPKDASSYVPLEMFAPNVLYLATLLTSGGRPGAHHELGKGGGKGGAKVLLSWRHQRSQPQIPFLSPTEVRRLTSQVLADFCTTHQ